MARSVVVAAVAVAVAGALLALGAPGGRGVIAQAPAASAAPGAAADPRPAQPVRITHVRFDAPADRVSYTGTVRPARETPLAFRLAGKIAARPAEVGDRVAAGQVLARLDDTDVRLDLEAAEAEVAAARADLARAGAEAVRSRALFAGGHVASAAVDRATSAAAEARARLDRGTRSAALAANRMSYATLRAETAGVVTAVQADAGQVVAAGQPVVSVARTDALDVVFALPELGRARLLDATATAVLWGDEGRVYALALRDLSPDVDPVARTYRVRMTLTDPDAAVALGRTVTVQLSTTAATPAAALPLAAVLNDGRGAAVWRLLPGGERVERVAVTVTRLAGQVALVEGALAAGDAVIGAGARKVDPARPVRVVETVAAPTM